MILPIPHDVRLIALVAFFSVSGWAQTPEIDALRARSESGEAQAQYDLGHHYADGQGVDQEYEEAHRLWRLAAAQGLTMAMPDLGMSYDLGRGVPQDDVQAYMWWSLAASRFPMATGEREVAGGERDALARRMTAAELAAARRLARVWETRHSR